MISKQRYISSTWQEQEWRLLWRRCWQVAAPLSDLNKPGDFVVYDIGPEGVLLSRGDDCELRAFYNVCRHRGLRLVDQRCGTKPNFRCPYHSWRYNRAGELASAPADESFSAGLPSEQLNLRSIACEAALGFAWICFEPRESLADYLQDMLPLMVHYKFEQMHLTLDQTVRVNCNWKAVHDNFSELYHVHFLHPQHRRFVDCGGATDELYPRGHTRVIVPGATTDSLFSTPDEPTDILTAQLTALGLNPDDFKGRVGDIQQAVQQAKRALGDTELPYYRKFSDQELSDVVQTNIFPNTILSYQPEMLWLIRPRPHPTDPNQCYLDKLSFERFPDGSAQTDSDTPAIDVQSIARHATPSGSVGRPEHEQFDYKDVIEGRNTMTDTIDQDLSLLAHAQQGMQSDGFDNLWLSDQECRVSHFHEELDRYMECSE